MNFARPFKLVTNGGTLASILLAGALAGCAGSSAPSSSVPPLSNSSMTNELAVDAVHVWGRSILQVPLRSAGCFEASYPELAWSRIACATTPRSPLLRSGNDDPATIGNLHDYALSVSPRHISTAIGSFPEVAGVKRVWTAGVPSLGKCTICGTDDYSLQLNSDFFSTAACGTNAKCVGWEQLIYANPGAPHGKVGQLFIQDWLVKTSSTPLKCPKTTGWRAVFGDCYYSSSNVNIPKIPIARLDELSASLSAAPTGDSAFLADGTTVYGMKDTQGDFMDLSRHWSGAEFNIFGDCCYSRAMFNPGSKITVRLEADYGSAAAPRCPNAGTTGETNSLSFIAAPSSPPKQQYPSILFKESNVAGGGAASCDSVAGL